MFVWLTEYLVKYSPWFNAISYIRFRVIASLLTSLFISLWIGRYIINYLQQLSFMQTIRDYGPRSHLKKYNTPTMGGIIILIAIIGSTVIWTNLSNPYVWYLFFVLISYAIIGCIDDYYKIIYKNTKGLLVFWKYFWMSVIALVIACILYITDRNIVSTTLVVPFLNYTVPQPKLFYILLVYFVIVGTGNAVNLTDGLDGLAIMPIIFVASGFSLVAWVTSNINLANYLHIPYLPYANELVIICSSIIGAGLGFLWFNTYPAQIFMGDIGSLSLGGTLGIIAVLLRQEFLLAIMGGVFVIEAISVILQIISFKLRKQRIFCMAPIHHHYELKGYPEPRIIVRFWIISLIFTIIGLATIKVI